MKTRNEGGERPYRDSGVSLDPPRQKMGFHCGVASTFRNTGSETTLLVDRNDAAADHAALAVWGGHLRTRSSGSLAVRGLERVSDRVRLPIRHIEYPPRAGSGLCGVGASPHRPPTCRCCACDCWQTMATDFTTLLPANYFSRRAACLRFLDEAAICARRRSFFCSGVRSFGRAIVASKICSSVHLRGWFVARFVNAHNFARSKAFKMSKTLGATKASTIFRCSRGRLASSSVSSIN